MTNPNCPKCKKRVMQTKQRLNYSFTELGVKKYGLKKYFVCPNCKLKTPRSGVITT